MIKDMLKNRYQKLVVVCMLILGGAITGGIKAEAAESIENETIIEEVLETEELIYPINLSDEDKTKMIELGFTEEELSTITQEEYDTYINLDGELTSVDNNYFKIITDSDGEILSTTEVSEETALIQSNESLITPYASNTTKTSWMSMTTTSSKLSNGNTLLKNSFKWLSSPQIALTDVIGISHSASAVKVPNTETFSYKYTDGKGTHSLGATSTVRNDKGIAKKFNLKAMGVNQSPKNHNGYISIQVKKGNKSDIRANAYGHYTHVTLGITGSIDIKTGSVSVGGNLSKSNMPSTMILFNY